MSVMNRVRLYHATLAILALLAYLTGEIEPVHAWIGYGVATIIVLRLLWAIAGERQAGLMRFYPKFDGLKLKTAATHPAISRVLMLGIALSLLTIVGTGIAMDQGRALGLNASGAERAGISTERPERHGDRHDDDREHGEGHEHEGGLSEVHETAVNFLLLFVVLHVAYLLTFKRPLARFMLFLPVAGKRKPAAVTPPT